MKTNKMKKLFIIFIVLTNYSLAQTYTWATSDSSYRSSWGARACLAKDSSGNLFVAYAPLNYSYSANAIYIIKYDLNHNRLWTQTVSALGIGECGIAICTDISGNVYLTSIFNDSLFVGSTMCASVSGGNMFLIKLNSQGVFQWVKNSTGSSGSAIGISLSTDVQNNIYLAGRVNENAYFDGIYMSNPSCFAYIAKYNASGSLLWIKGISAGYGFPKIKTDIAGNTYMAGTFNYTTHFDNISITASDPYSDGSPDIYIAKIDSSGNWLWAIRSGGVGQDELADFNIDAQNNLYVTGYSESPTAMFGSITTTNTTGGDYYFAAKYDSNGNAIWAISGGGPNSFGYGICGDKQGNAYLSHSSSFISKYDNAGNLLWLQSKPAAANIDMLADDSGSVYIVGFQNTASFDSFSFTPNQAGMFVAELYDPPEITTNIKGKENNIDISVYPNPATNIITVSIQSSFPKESFTLKVTNTLSQIVHFETIKDITGSCIKQIDLSYLPKGFYFVELQSSSLDSSQKKSEVKKIVLQ